VRIGIDLSPAVYKRAGIGRYAHELALALRQSAPQNDYVAIYNRLTSDAEPPEPLNQLPSAVIPWRDKSWRARVLVAQYVRQSQDRLFPDMDIFHGTDHLLPYLKQTPTVLTVHDLTYLLTDTHTTLNSLFLKLAMPRFLAEAKAIITPSESTKLDLLRHYHVPSDKVNVIPEGVDPRFFIRDPGAVERVRRKYHLPASYLLTVGTIEPRKNHSRLLEARLKLSKLGVDIPLVIAGKAGWRSATVVEEMSQLEQQYLVQYLGFVDDRDLPALYQAATTFIYPSLYEGFGLPVLEAMASGTPVVTSSTSSLPEVAGEAAILINPHEPKQMAHAIQRLLAEPELRNELQHKGILRARSFAWDKTATETINVYSRVHVASRGI